MLSKDAPMVVALVDASSEEPPFCLGKLVSLHQSPALAMIADLDYRSGEINPRTRVIRLNKPLPIGAMVDSRVDVAPMNRPQARWIRTDVFLVIREGIILQTCF
jgi:hypothetical protein